MKLTALFGMLLMAAPLFGEEPLRLAIAGLVHGHASGFFRALKSRSDARLVGVWEPDVALQKQYAKQFDVPENVFYTDLARMLETTKPEAVAAFTNTYDHAMVVEAAAARKLPVMMEKPLAVSMEHARAIQKAAQRAGIPVVVNYETTWYANHAALRALLKEGNAGGEIRKMVAMDGHSGPKEIGVGPEFLGWLTDPVKNGAGALFDLAATARI